MITAGASAPDYLVQNIVRDLIQNFDIQVEESTTVEENIHFSLPHSLRLMINGKPMSR